jgi:translation elongation factor EF-Ts
LLNLHILEQKSSLASLRKKTGYSLSLCKQALAETDYNLDKAEKWLEVEIAIDPRTNLKVGQFILL